MLSFPATHNAPQPPSPQPSPLPRRTDSLSTSVAKPKPTSPLVQSTEDLHYAKEILSTPIITEDDEGIDDDEREQRREERERQLIDVLGRMTGWVEELTTLLQQAYKNQTDLETALTLTRSNLQLALANNEMLEEALKRGGKDVGWRRWSEREGIRRTGSVKEYSQPDRPNSVSEPAPQPSSASGASRFFSFKSPLQRVSSSNSSPISPSSSPTGSQAASASSPSLLPSISIPSSSSGSTTPVHGPNGVLETPPVSAMSVYSTVSSYRPPSPPSPSQREKELADQLEKERSALQQVAKEKSQLEDELESLSQALFEEANKMVSKANQKLAETEEELRVTTEQKEALKGALRIVEGENGQLRGRSSPNPDLQPPDAHSSREWGRQRDRDRSQDPPAHPLERDPTPQRAPTRPSMHVTTPPPQSPPPPPPSQQQLLHPTPPTPIPAVTVTDTLHTPSTKMFWSPLTPNEGVSNRWSVLPQTPRSRSVVRNEFEDAMRRMQELVGEAGEGGDSPVALRVHPLQQGHEAGHPLREHEEPVSPRIQFALQRSESDDGHEVEDEVKVRGRNPWTVS